MQVEIKIDSSYAEPKVIILTAAVTEDVNTVLNKLDRKSTRLNSSHQF